MNDNQFFQRIKEIVNYQIKDLENQIPLNIKDITCPNNITYTNEASLVSMRVLRLLALREAFGGKLSYAILYASGKQMGEKDLIVDNSEPKINTLEDLINYFNDLLLGEFYIVCKDESKIIIEEKNCTLCSGLPNIGEPVCSFEAGFIAGVLAKLNNKYVKVTETKCWALGDDVCRFEAVLYPKESLLTEDENNMKPIDMITSLASKASMTIELNKELQYKNDIFNKQLEFAQNIQKKIIPKQSDFNSENYKLFTYLKPFRKVGGDFYDFYNLPNGKMGLAIADMAGHGIDAAMITSMIKLIFTYCSRENEIISKPAKVIKRLENDIKQQIPNTFFSTIYLVLDPNIKKIKYINAGHPAAILYKHKTKEIKLLQSNLPLLGLTSLLSNVVYKEKVIEYEKGDKLFLYTDGITDARNPNGEFFTIEKMTAIIMENNTQNINQICKSILDGLHNFKQNKLQSDDVCLMGIEL